MSLNPDDIHLDDAVPFDHDAAVSPRNWQKPKAVHAGLLEVDAFDPKFLPDAVSGWVMDISDRIQCPPDFVAVSAMATLGSTLGCKIAVAPQRRTTWLEAPNLWALVVGRPGALKSPAMQEALKPLHRMEADARKAGIEAMADYELQVEAYKIIKSNVEGAAKKAVTIDDAATILRGVTAPEKPQTPRYVVNDTTFERLGEILAASPNGVLSYRDEIVSLLKTLDAPEQAAARGFFLSSWSGLGSYTFDRISRGQVHIEHACVSMLGSTQPGKLAEYLSKANAGGNGDDGFIQRFGLLVWPDGNQEWANVDRFPDSGYRNRAYECFDHLDKIRPDDLRAERDEFGSVPFLRFDDEAAEMFLDWRVRLEASLRSGEMSPALESHVSKYRKLMPALALINHVADGGTGSIGANAITRAECFADYLQTHARRAYASGQELEAAAGRAILRRIRKGDLVDGFTARDIRRAQWSGLTNIELIKSGLELLSDLNWVAPVQVQTGGRSKVTFAINPEATR